MKYIKDGKVAVIISPNFGTPFSAGYYRGRDPFNYEIAELLAAGESDKAIELAESKYEGIIGHLEIEWVDIGAEFYISEYDGSEELILLTDLKTYKA